MDGTDGGANIWPAMDLCVDFHGAGSISILLDARIFIRTTDAGDGEPGCGLGNINIDDFSLINSLNGPLVLDANAGLDINISTFSLKYIP